MISQSFMDACNKLQAAKGERDVKRAIQSFLENKGYWAFNLGFIDTLNHELEEAPVRFISTMPAGWIDHYNNERYDLIDPGVIQVRNSKFAPVFTGMEMRPEMPSLTAAQEKMLEFGRDANVRSGVIVPLSHYANPAMPPSGIGLISDMSRKEYLKIWAEEANETLLFLNYMNQILSVPVTKLMLSVQDLTPRERDCLAYLAQGYRPEAISDKICLATVTVNVHIRRARQKLRAVTNAQAVAKAVRLNLI